MNGDVTNSQVPPGAVETAQFVFQQWNATNQQAAIDRLTEPADRAEPWALALMVWLSMQQGAPGFDRALPYAQKAQSLGMPWVPYHLYNNMVGHIASAPHLLDQLVDLIQEGTGTITSALDPVGQAWGLLSQGQIESAVKLMGVTMRFSPNPESWDAVVRDAQRRTNEVRDLLADAQSTQADLRQIAARSEVDIEKWRTDLETKARQAELLISSVNSGAVNALFDAEAKRNAGESKTSWRWGIGVLAAAACVAVLPLVLHYLGIGPDYSMGGLLGAHAGSTAALGAVAGVLLARARGRDRAHQRARDLSTAMGTMISYSNQIQDEAEKQRFMLTMGQLVLQAHLQGDSGGAKEDSFAGLAALLSVMRQPSTSPT
ncbi:hypothetical protein [Nocardioides lijunqiniae]|uniref:hypothetical protein n=1 Tax=Nocardioides lijunqiniae TaxID=2760832 RepID=UPI001878AA5C|nr:hypothetical protein [Nocardioides lijunqiniae]